MLSACAGNSSREGEDKTAVDQRRQRRVVKGKKGRGANQASERANERTNERTDGRVSWAGPDRAGLVGLFGTGTDSLTDD
jgi:hypothetical protein